MRVKIYESHKVDRQLERAPGRIVLSYEIWSRLVEEHGYQILRSFKGYRDKRLAGKWQGHRASRLSRQWRIIYKISHQGLLEIVKVCRVSAHDYGR